MTNFKNPADFQAMIRQVVRTAVEYGYLRGYGHAVKAARVGQSGAPETDVHAQDLRPILAQQAAEEFLVKVQVELIIS